MIFLVWLRVAALPGCKVMPESGADTLECALEAETPEDVRALLDDALHRHRQSVAELEACIEFRPSDWNDANDPGRRIRKTASAAREHGGVHFASFGQKPPSGVR